LHYELRGTIPHKTVCVSSSLQNLSFSSCLFAVLVVNNEIIAVAIEAHELRSSDVLCRIGEDFKSVEFLGDTEVGMGLHGERVLAIVESKRLVCGQPFAIFEPVHLFH
jgi:hypothetical protein